MNSNESDNSDEESSEVGTSSDNEGDAANDEDDAENGTSSNSDDDSDDNTSSSDDDAASPLPSGPWPQPPPGPAGDRPLFSAAEERDMVDWLGQCNALGLVVTRQHFTEEVHRIVQMEQRANCTYEDLEKWVSKFISRLSPQLSRATTFNSLLPSAGIEARRSAPTPSPWYISVNAAMFARYQDARFADPDSALYLGAINLRLNPAQALVSSIRQDTRMLETAADDSLNVAYVAAVSASGERVPPMWVIPSSGVVRDDRTKEGGGCFLQTTSNGKLNSTALMAYLLRVVEPFLRLRQVQRPVLLYVNGLDSHCSMAVTQYCDDEQLLLVGLPPGGQACNPLQVAVGSLVAANFDRLTAEARQGRKKAEDGRMTASLNNVMAGFAQATRRCCRETIKQAFYSSLLFPWTEAVVMACEKGESCVEPSTCTSSAKTVSSQSSGTKGSPANRESTAAKSKAAEKKLNADESASARKAGITDSVKNKNVEKSMNEKPESMALEPVTRVISRNPGSPVKSGNIVSFKQSNHAPASSVSSDPPARAAVTTPTTANKKCITLMDRQGKPLKIISIGKPPKLQTARVAQPNQTTSPFSSLSKQKCVSQVERAPVRREARLSGLPTWQQRSVVTTATSGGNDVIMGDKITLKSEAPSPLPPGTDLAPDHPGTGGWRTPGDAGIDGEPPADPVVLPQARLTEYLIALAAAEVALNREPYFASVVLELKSKLHALHSARISLPISPGGPSAAAAAADSATNGAAAPGTGDGAAAEGARCAVGACPLHSGIRDGTARLHPFPAGARLAKRWLQACALLPNTDCHEMFVCDRHFVAADYLCSSSPQNGVQHGGPGGSGALRCTAVPSRLMAAPSRPLTGSSPVAAATATTTTTNTATTPSTSRSSPRTPGSDGDSRRGIKRPRRFDDYHWEDPFSGKQPPAAAAAAAAAAASAPQQTSGVHGTTAGARSRAEGNTGMEELANKPPSALKSIIKILRQENNELRARVGLLERRGESLARGMTTLLEVYDRGVPG